MFIILVNKNEEIYAIIFQINYLIYGKKKKINTKFLIYNYFQNLFIIIGNLLTNFSLFLC